MDLLRRILQCADTRDDAIWSFDEVQQWDPVDLQWLLDSGLVKEGPPAKDIYLCECDAQEVFEPQWVTHHVSGERVGLCVCQSCGTTHTVRAERMRTWSTSFAQVTGVLSQALATDAQFLLYDHVARLGQRDGYELFLVRGLRWRPGLIVECPRLRDTRAAVVLSLGAIPERHLWPAGWHQVLKVSEHVTTRSDDVDLQIPLAGRGGLADHPKAAQEQSARPGNEPEALTRAERDILQAVGEQGGEPVLLVQLEAAAGYGKHTVRACVNRLLKLQLLARAGGAVRKGVVLGSGVRSAHG